MIFLQSYTFSGEKRICSLELSEKEVFKFCRISNYQ